tara:strand:+ start:4521 stop:5879 length:1359 start_codon:yes stop_codon:yes gene_type:complete
MNKKALLKKRKAALTSLNALLEDARDESRELTAEETATYDGYKASITDCDAKLAEAAEVDRMNAEGVRLAALEGEPTRRALFGEPVNTGHSDQEMTDLDSFRVVSFLRGAVNRSTGDGAPLEGIEREMSQEARRESNEHGVDLKGIGIPQMVLNHRGRTNAMSVSGSNVGSDLVPTDLGSMIDLLRDSMVLSQLGAQHIGGLSGNVEWPTIVDGAEPVEKTEVAEATVRTLGTGIVTSTPHRLPVVSEYSSQLLQQSSTDVEALVRADLMTTLGIRMEKQAINGDGSGANVLGLLGTSGIGAVVGGVNGALITEDHLIDLEGAVELVNAATGNLGYLVNVKTKTRLKKTVIEAGQTDKVWHQDGSLNGYSSVGVTNLVPSTLTKGSSGAVASAVIFGNFNDMLLNQWGGLDVIVNPYTKDSQGIVRVTVSSFFDMVLRRAASFAAMQDALTA